MKLYVHKDTARKRNIEHFSHRDVLCIGMRGCNLDCSWCMNGRLHHSKDYAGDFRENMTTIRKKILAEDPAKTIIGFGYGEPSMHHETIELATFARDNGFLTYITTNGYMYTSVLDRVLSKFHFIDLDIKAPPSPNSKLAEHIKVPAWKYFLELEKMIDRCRTGNKPINVTVLHIPEFYEENTDEFPNAPFVNLGHLLSRLPNGSSVHIRQFHAMAQVVNILSSPTEEETREFMEKLQRFVSVGSGLTFYFDPCWQS